MHEIDIQLADAVLMIRPSSFGYNAETATTNAFQHQSDAGNVLAAARTEFDGVVGRLRAAGVDVMVLDDQPKFQTPDAVFPNNWFSTDRDGTIVLYPIHAPNRRRERRSDVIDALRARFSVSRIADFSRFEAESAALEGTGSLVFDHRARRAYAALSPRTQDRVLEAFAEDLGYEVVTFRTDDGSGKPIYHTNVLLAIGSAFAVVCPDVIAGGDRERVRHHLGQGRTLIEISRDQMFDFAGNILELATAGGGRVIVLSETAHAALSSAQRDRMTGLSELLPVAIPTIERVGGGGVRCMLAELRLPRLR